MTWECNTTGHFSGRYEHSCFIPMSYPEKIYIFGGADLTGNKNDIQVLDTNSMEWTTVEVDGSQPSPRTQHHSAAFRDYLVVFGGGDAGANPVSDSDIHIFNATTQSWSILKTTGKCPCNRHGHAIVASGNIIYVHGGMSGSTFYDDLFSLDMETCTWNELFPKGRKPSARAAHGAVAVERSIFIFGGLCSKGALNELFHFDTEEQTWNKITISRGIPSARLDFAICSIYIETENRDNENSRVSETTNNYHEKNASSRSSSSWLSNTSMRLNPPKHSEVKYPNKRCAIFIHGGMDTEGNIFDDAFIYLI